VSRANVIPAKNFGRRARCGRAGLLGALGLAFTAATAQVPTDTSASAAPHADQTQTLQRCEAAVIDTLRKLRGAAAQDVQFLPGERVVSVADETEVGVKGAGRYSARNARAGTSSGNRFTFSCTFNAKSDSASGVVLREPISAAAAQREAAWQPDLSRVSPEACESAAAQLLKNKHPRVASIAFEPDTRRLQPGPDEHILLLGQGAVQRAPGMNAVPFNYSCEIDPRNGRVLGVKTSV
jgi:hypothetical protein